MVQGGFQVNLELAEVIFQPLINAFFNINFVSHHHFLHFLPTLTSAQMNSVVKKAEVMFTNSKDGPK